MVKGRGCGCYVPGEEGRSEEEEGVEEGVEDMLGLVARLLRRKSWSGTFVDGRIGDVWL
jgi:hypothetical protein